TFGVVFGRELVGPEGVEGIAIVHRDVDAVVISNREHLSQAGRPARAIVLFLAELVLVELPDSTVFLQELARILPGSFRTAIRVLAGVGRCADIDVEPSLAVESNTFVAVLPHTFKTGYDDLRSG